jgi:hypothetical protein
VRGSGLLPPGGTACSMGPCGPRGGGLESPIRHSGIPRCFSIRPSRQSICWSSSLSVGDSDIGSSRSSLGARNWDGQRSSPSSTEAKEARNPKRLEPTALGIREGAQRCAPFQGTRLGAIPDPAPRPMLPLYDPAIYAPRLVTRQPSVSSSTTSWAFGFSFSAIVIA